MLPPPNKSKVEVSLADHVFTFRRLDWREEIHFSQQAGVTGRQAYIANALTAVDGKAVTYDQSLALLKTLPRPIYERVVIFYLGSLPGRRILTSDTPWAAPEPAAYQSRVADEDQEILDEEERLLERTFGHDEVEEQRELARRMVAGTKGAGISRSLSDDETLPPPGPRAAGDLDEEPPRYHMVVT